MIEHSLFIDTSNGQTIIGCPAVGWYIMPPKGDSLSFLVKQHQVIQEALAKDNAALSMIAVVIGPGALTGVRVGVGFATGLAYGANLKVLAIPSLHLSACLAAVRYQVSHLAVFRDARMHQFYWGEYQISESLKVLGEGVMSHDDVHTLSVPNQYIDPCAHSQPKQSQTLAIVEHSEYPEVMALLMKHLTWQTALDVKPIYWRPSVIQS